MQDPLARLSEGLLIIQHISKDIYPVHFANESRQHTVNAANFGTQ
jgi:hypothetical protein